ncbi:MAG: hypothetical protein H6511_09195 [Holophagales bacterium]|nr:hypothetical protein [Holophagales bacterium]
MRLLGKTCTFVVAGLALGLAMPLPASAEEGGADSEFEFDWGFEAKANYRDSESFRFPSPFPFPPEFLPPGESRGFLETVNAGGHFEVSVLTLLLDARWGEGIASHVKVDFIDLYDRNPTSSDKKVDVDELWIRFGPDPLEHRGSSLYGKVGKFAHFERQNDRHLESYGLVSTAFNRFEDQGVELGASLGRHVYLRFSATQGNPLFFRDPNALAGDNGTPELDPAVHVNPNPALKSGIPILYDAEVEDLDVDGDLELGYGLGFRFGDRDEEGWAVDLLGWSYERTLAETVALEGTFYGGDLDLLLGPGNAFPLPVRGDEKSEVGGNLWVYAGGFAFFAQYVDQEIAGMQRTGYEAEASWRFDLPLVWAVGGRQLFPSIQPAVRFSRLEPEFAGGSPAYPAPSVRWEWDKLDFGVRLGIVQGVDLTIELADNTMTLASGREISYDELLTTLRWRVP